MLNQPPFPHDVWPGPLFGAIFWILVGLAVIYGPLLLFAHVSFQTGVVFREFGNGEWRQKWRGLWFWALWPSIGVIAFTVGQVAHRLG
jgi:ABC-type spermidine/putrescine transport system permease subunit II